MATEVKNAFRELCQILLTLNIFIVEDKDKMPNWLKIISRKYPNCTIGSGKDVDEADISELQKKFNEAIKLQSTFGYQVRESEAYGDSLVIVIPTDVKEKLKAAQPTGLLETYAAASCNAEMKF